MRTPVKKPSRQSEWERRMAALLFAQEDLPQPSREYPCVPSRKFRFDFAWPVERVCVELHGATFARGRHVTGLGFELDREKMNLAQLEDPPWTVLEYTTAQLRRDPDSIIKQIRRALERRRR